MPCMHTVFCDSFTREHGLWKSWCCSQHSIHLTHHQTMGINACPHSIMGNIPINTTKKRKVAATLLRGDGILLFVFIRPVNMFSFVLSIYFKFNLIPMTQDGLITRTATILTWTESSIGLLSVIASLIAGCHLGRKHTGSMHQLGTALILVFIVWLICVNILPTTIFYLLGISHPTAFTCFNMFSAFSNTLVYIYAYYRMYRTINN